MKSWWQRVFEGIGSKQGHLSKPRYAMAKVTRQWGPKKKKSATLQQSWWKVRKLLSADHEKFKTKCCGSIVYLVLTNHSLGFAAKLLLERSLGFYFENTCFYIKSKNKDSKITLTNSSFENSSRSFPSVTDTQKNS